MFEDIERIWWSKSENWNVQVWYDTSSFNTFEEVSLEEEEEWALHGQPISSASHITSSPISLNSLLSPGGLPYENDVQVSRWNNVQKIRERHRYMSVEIWNFVGER